MKGGRKMAEKTEKPAEQAEELSFDDFYRRSFQNLLRYCRASARLSAADAEEIVEDAFVALWKHWGELETHTEIGLHVWTTRSIRLLTAAFFRKKAREPEPMDFEQLIEEAERDPERRASAEDHVIERETYATYLQQIRERLNANERNLFDCVIVGELTVRQTADRLHMKENTVKVSLCRLRKKLRERILPELLPASALPTFGKRPPDAQGR